MRGDAREILDVGYGNGPTTAVGKPQRAQAPIVGIEVNKSALTANGGLVLMGDI